MTKEPSSAPAGRRSVATGEAARSRRDPTWNPWNAGERFPFFCFFFSAPTGRRNRGMCDGSSNSFAPPGREEDKGYPCLTALLWGGVGRSTGCALQRQAAARLHPRLHSAAPLGRKAAAQAAGYP